MSEWIFVELCDDWVGLYINGKLAEQNHSLNFERALEEGPLPTSFARLKATDEFAEEEGSLPEEYVDIPPEYLEPME